MPDPAPSTGSILPIPENIAKIVGKAKDTDPILRVKNYAGNENTAAAATAFAKANWSTFDAQAARAKMKSDMNDADKFYRMSEGTTKQDENLTRGTVDCIPHIFFEGVRMVTAYETNLLYNREDPFGKYLPYSNLDPLLKEHTQEICDQQQLLFDYSNEMDDRIEKLKREQLFINKYGNRLVGMDWFSEEMEITERVPTGMDENKNPTGFSWKTRKVKKQHPRFFSYDLKDAWFDTNIMDADFQNHQCVLLRSTMDYTEIIKEQQAGHFMNVEKITTAHAYQGETPETVLSDRQMNAGETSDANRPNGQYERWDVPMKAPINDDGEWDEKNTMRKWHILTFIGPLASGGVICVRAIPNPCKRLLKIPFKLIHSHPDDKGALNAGYVNYTRPVWNEMKTTLDQWFDNKNLVNFAPMKVEEGAILSKDKSFGPRKILTMRRGQFDKAERFMIPSNTQDMQVFIANLKQDAWDIFGITKAFRGEAMMGRTSSSEAQNAHSQSMLTGSEKAKYIADQLLPWLAETDEDMWRQFAPADLVIALTREGQLQEIKPATLYGHLRYKVTAIDDNENTALTRLEADRFVQGVFPLASKYMGQKGIVDFFKWLCGLHKLPSGNMFPANSDADAKHVAKSENYSFLQGEWVAPEPQQDHEAHEKEHDQFIALLQTLPANQKPTGVLENAKMHRLMHEQMKQQSSQPQQPP